MSKTKLQPLNLIISLKGFVINLRIVPKKNTTLVKKVPNSLKNKEVKDNKNQSASEYFGLTLKICGQIYGVKFECLKLSKTTMTIANLSLIFSLNSKFAEYLQFLLVCTHRYLAQM